MSKTSAKDGRVDTRISNYTAFWEKDKSKESQIGTDNRTENYEEVINGESSTNATSFSCSYISGYYDGATELYEWGWAQSFHFCRFNRGENFNAAVSLYLM
jgi:sterol 24-C-methyltransferase